MRAVSTVVDATIFLLVLGVAVATLVGVPSVVNRAPVDRADAMAEHLATGTERVEYSLASAARALDGDPPIEGSNGPRFRRSAHGTLASLLADAAVATVTVDGDEISADGTDFAAAVVDRTERRILAPNRSVAVRATWEPYPAAPIRGSVAVGSAPPPAVDVHAATVTVDAPIPTSRDAALAAADRDGFDGVAHVVARTVVEGLFPRNRTRLALRGDYPVDALVANRYAKATVRFGGEPWKPTPHTDVAAGNERIAGLLAERLAADLRQRYPTPSAAAGNVSTGVVTITVRTWSR